MKKVIKQILKKALVIGLAAVLAVPQVANAAVPYAYVTTYQQLVDALAAGKTTITVQSNITLQDTLNLSADVTIVGSNPTIELSGNDTFTLINAGECNLTVRRLVLSRGASVGAHNLYIGGAIYANTGSVTVDSCTIKNNQAVNGGAIQVNTGRLSIYDSKFIDNTETGTSCNGGAIYYEGSPYFPMIVHRTTFENNVTQSHGGAIYCKYAPMQIYDCKFKNNTAAGCGGAVFSDASNKTTVDVQRSTFTGNTGTSGVGGAIYSKNAILAMRGCTYTSNTCLGPGKDAFNANYILISDQSGSFATDYGRVLSYPSANDDRVYSAASFGAVGDGVTFDADYIQLGLDFIKEQGGGTLQIPAGDYLVSSLRFYDNTYIELMEGCTIIADPNESDYGNLRGKYDTFYTRDSMTLIGQPENSLDIVSMSYLQGERGCTDTLFFTTNTTNVGIKGEGTIDGRYVDFFNTSTPGQLSETNAPRYLRRTTDGVIYDYHVFRPRVMIFLQSSNLSVTGITINNAAHYNIQIVLCQNITVSGVTINTLHALPNTDGINIYGSSHATLSDCYIHCGDDPIALSGADSDITVTNVTTNGPTCFARLFVGIDAYFKETLGIGSQAEIDAQKAITMSDITIQNCTMEEGNGFLLAYAAYGTVHDLQVIDCVGSQTYHGSGIFLCSQGGGRLYNVTVDGLDFTGNGAMTIIGSETNTSVSNIAIKNSTFHISPETKLFGNNMIDPVTFYNCQNLLPYNINIRHASDVTITNCALHWGTADFSEMNSVSVPGQYAPYWRADMNPNPNFAGLYANDVNGLMLSGCDLSGYGTGAACETHSVSNFSNISYPVTEEGIAQVSTEKQLRDAVMSGEGQIEVMNDIELTSTLTLSADATIFGSEETQMTLSAKTQSFRLINAENHALTLKNIRLTNGSATEGDILVGGALYANAGNVTLVDCEVDHNRAINGGAIQVNTGKLTVKNCYIHDNVELGVGCKGGAVFYEGAPGKTLTIIGSTFENNVSKSDGGAVFSNTSPISITDSVFRNNRSEGSGGAVSTPTQTVTATDSTFEGNTCAAVGGAILADTTGDLIIERCVFRNNTANIIGGALFKNSGTLRMENSRAENNTAASGGGVIFANGDTIILNNNYIVDNQTINGSGSVVYLTAGSVTAHNNHTENNKAGAVVGQEFVMGSGSPNVTNDIQLAGRALELAGKIGANYFFKVTADTQDLTLRLTIPDAGTPKIQTLSVADAQIQNVGGRDYYVFTPYVTSIEMNQDIIAQFFRGDTPVSAAYPYQVSDYARTVVDNADDFDAKLVSLCKALLNYGAYAQLQFDYHTDDLPNSVLAPAQRTVSAVTAENTAQYQHSVEGSTTGLVFAGNQLALETGAVIKVLVKLGSGANIDDYTFTVNGKKMTPVRYSGDYYRVTYAPTPSNWLKRDQALVVTHQEETMTVHINALSYVYTALSADDSVAPPALKNVCRALVCYADAAEKFFS